MTDRAKSDNGTVCRTFIFGPGSGEAPQPRFKVDFGARQAGNLADALARDQAELEDALNIDGALEHFRHTVPQDADFFITQGAFAGVGTCGLRIPSVML